ncbi:aminoacyl-tRNA hydrolase [Alphaproteobacteria bacterium]|nr:aminoacyl-tRNA hydrolase [Alphaproteobacteria bacterium]
MYLLAGLGNKGAKFTNTRHNIGFEIIDKIISQYEFKKDKKNVDIHSFKGTILDKKVILLKPMTFMNNSGTAVSKIVSFYKIPTKNVFVIHDDMDLVLSKIKIKLGGSSAGHNGIKSIDMHIGKDYYRIRIGIGKPEKYLEAKDYVLQRFTSEENLNIKKKINILVNNIPYLINNDINNLLNIMARN